MLQVGLDPALGGLRLDEIQSFLVLSEDLHFHHAAAKLYITASCLSRRIAHVERALGEALFVRTTRSVSLTEAGHRFVACARRLMTELEALTQPST